MSAGEPSDRVPIDLAKVANRPISPSIPPDRSARDPAVSGGLHPARELLETAFVDGDTSAACDLLSGNGRVEVIATAAALGADPECEAAIQATLELAGQDDLDRIARATDELGPDDVQVTGDQATVTLRSGKTLGLVKSDDGWLIDRP